LCMRSSAAWRDPGNLFLSWAMRNWPLLWVSF
jgi:hypothetical protein